MEGTAFTNVYIYADKEIVNDNDAPALIAVIPADASNTATINGSIVLTFNERVKSGSGNSMLGASLLTGVYGTKTATFPYEKLAYNTNYTFTVPAGAITDMSGNPYPGLTVSFKTAQRIEPVKKVFDAVVATDGSGDYTSVIAAISAAPSNRQLPWVIFIKNGIYTGHHEIPQTKPFIHLIGQSRDGVIIKDNLTADNGGVAVRSTMVVQSTDCYFENFIIENSHGYLQQTGPMAEALYTNNDKFAMKNVYLRSFQDTYLTSGRNMTDRHYILGSRIEGSVDFIYGSGDVFFDKDTLTITRAGSYIVAPAHQVGTSWGYVFKDNIINQDKVSGNISSSYGRPWQNAPKAVFINSKLLTGIHPDGWSQWNIAPAIFADYGTMNANGDLIDLSQRRTSYTVTSSNSTVTAKNSLTDEEAATYTYENIILRTGDSWDPRMIAEAPDKPANLNIVNGLLKWDATSFTRLYVVSRDNAIIGFSMLNEFQDNTAVQGINYKYAVQAANEYGALSELSEIIQTLPVTGFKLKATKLNFATYLNWQTLTEKRTEKFVIERTIDGLSFESIGERAAGGESNNLKEYFFTDHSPLKGVNVYRIKSVDFDGFYDYSDPVAVNYSEDIEVSMYPNPSTDIINVIHPAKSELSIIDLSGKKVMKQTAADAGLTTINISVLTSGTYILKISSRENNINRTIKFIKN